jgi:hypothetical protein
VGVALKVSSTELGYYASSRFCPRCAWVRLHVKPLPFQAFPGIFSSIDRYNKLVVHSYFQRESCLPVWLRQLGEVEACVTPPHWSHFSVLDQGTGVTLRGEADAIFKMADGSHAIVDYKTSRYTPGQGALFPVYEAQLNAYAYIGERLDLKPVSRLALVYMEPQTDEGTAHDPRVVDAVGFSMAFKATVVPVELKHDCLVPSLLKQARNIWEMDTPPGGLRGCKDCAATDDLLRTVR